MNDSINLADKLEDYFGYTAFQTGQEEIISDVLLGKDVLGVLPTGMGKSLCYQLPAKLLDGVTIVVSPLISLMIDQVKQLKAANFKEVIALNSFTNPIERKQIYHQLGNYKLIYVSPELLQQNEVLDHFKKLKVSLFVIDEAHCLSQWGHDFRPDYLRLNEVVADLKNPPILALSATATDEIQQDIKAILQRSEMAGHIYPMDRENIIFSIENVAGDNEKNDRINQLFHRIRVPTIIYFSSRMASEQITAFLLHKHPTLRVAFYHGGMDAMDRISVQQQFMNNQLDVICCTSAFGMGINKKDIRLIIHYHLPLQLESYIQEVGRAGRDGEESVSLLLYSEHDQYLPFRLIRKELPGENDLKFVIKQLYDLYRQNMQLPYKQDQVKSIFHLNEIQWGFLYYQFEKHGMIKGNQIIYQQDNWKITYHTVQNFINERLQTKEQKLRDMLAWIGSTRCLREQLYKGFQSSYKFPSHTCCSNCTFNLSNWEPERREIENNVHNWEGKLQALFASPISASTL